MTRPIAVDLFSGVGGMSLGFEQAGFDVLAAVEIDPVHAAAHAYNFPLCTTIPRSVKELSGRDIRMLSAIGRRKVDVVFGGAPCQGFSLIGQRVLDDPRNSLVKDFARIVRELDASYFVFENVKGLTLGKHRRFLEELIAEFKRAGYAVQTPWKVLNASSYGVPQHRERLFLMGAKIGLPLPKYPHEITALKSKNQVGQLPLAPTCKDALSDLPDAEKFRELLDNDAVRTSEYKKPSEYAREMRCLTTKGWHRGYRRIWDRQVLTASVRSDHTDISRKRFRNTKPGTVEPISRFLRLAPDGVANTLRAGTDAARGAFTSPRPIHYQYARCITVREMARLHGFPDWFRFHSTKWHGARQIGNAVPPPLARAVAAQLISAMGIKPLRPSKAIELGDSSLLYMDMSQAARYWGLPVNIAKRDRKSGAKKRKQEDIEALLMAAE